MVAPVTGSTWRSRGVVGRRGAQARAGVGIFHGAALSCQ